MQLGGGEAHLVEHWTGTLLVACDMPELCKFPSLDSCQKTGIDHASGSVVGLVLQVGDAEKFPQAFGFEGLDPFLEVAFNQGLLFPRVAQHSFFLCGNKNCMI